MKFTFAALLLGGVVAVGLTTLSGCSGSTSTPGGDAMSDAKMGMDDKMTHDAMSSGKMGVDAMAGDKMGMDKMAMDKMNTDKMATDKMSDEKK